MAFESLNFSLIASETLSNSLRGVARAANVAGDEAIQSGVEFGAFGEALDAVDDDALELAFNSRAAASGVDEVGDEAVESAAQLGAYSGAAATATTATEGLSLEMGPLHGRMGKIVALAATLGPPIAGLATGLTGVATASAAAAGGIGALAAGGILRQAEQMAASSDEFETATEAMQAIMKNFVGEIKAATEPLQTMANTEMVFSGMSALVDTVRMVSEVVADLRPTLMEIGGAFTDIMAETGPELFNQIASSVRTLTPIIIDWMSVLGDIPDLIAFLTEQAVILEGTMANTGNAFVVALAGITEFGTMIATGLLPVLNVLLLGMGELFGLMASIPEPIFQAAMMFGALTAALTVYTAVASAASMASLPLIGGLISLAGAISAPILAVAALGAAVVGIISYFGWWEEIIGSLQTTWNMFVGAIEWVLNSLLDLYDALGILGPILMPSIAIFTNLGEILQVVGGILEWLGGVAQRVASVIVEIFKMIGDVLGDVINVVDEVTNALGLDGAVTGEVNQEVNLSGLKADTADGPRDRSGPRDGGPRAPRGQGAPTVEKKTVENNYDFTNANFGEDGGGQTATQRNVEEAVKSANEEDRKREDATEF